MSRLVQVHLILLAVFALLAAVLLSGGCGGSDMCPGPQLGLVLLVIVIVAGFALAIGGAAGRASPLAVIDAIIAAPLIPTPLGMLHEPSVPILIASVVLALTVAGAVIAARAVATHRLERVVLAIVLITVALLFSGVASLRLGVVVPIILLVVLFVPPQRRPELDAPDVAE